MSITSPLSVKGALQSDPLCATFMRMAEKIWTTLQQARALGINRGEETVTDDLLLDVQTSHPAEVATFQFNKWEEGQTGADWEWWLTDGRAWLGLLVQAKILHAKSNLYSKIKHKVRGRPQIDILIEQAGRKGIPALYFFYNHTHLSFPPLTWKCGSTDEEIQQLGCTVADAFAIRPLVRPGGVGITSLDPVTMPLRCMICCRGRVLPPDDTLPNRAESIVRELQRLGNSGDYRASPLPLLRHDPPSYVRQLLAAPQDERHAVIDRLRAEVGPIGSLVILKERRDSAPG
ncbi:DUF6615 family protein [Bradyrhizobium sp. USDA 3315]